MLVVASARFVRMLCMVVLAAACGDARLASDGCEGRGHGSEAGQFEATLHTCRAAIAVGFGGVVMAVRVVPAGTLDVSVIVCIPGWRIAPLVR